MYQFGIWRNNYYAGDQRQISNRTKGNNNFYPRYYIINKKILVNEWIENLSTDSYKKWSKSNDIKIFK